MDEREQSRLNAEMARQDFLFLLLFPFLAGAFITVLFSVLGALRVLMSGGFGDVNDVLAALSGLVPIYFIIVLALFVGEGIYLICRKWR